MHATPDTYPTDAAILAAFPAASRKAHGREGCGVEANDLALVLAPEPGTYNVANEPTRRHIARRCGILVRKGLLSPGVYRGERFYRLAADRA
jgi:hypothetical protein